MSIRGDVWYRHLDAVSGGMREVECRSGSAFPDGTRLLPTSPLADEADDDPLVWRTHLTTDSSLLRIEFGTSVASGAPDLWFVAVPEPRTSPPASNLVAFASEHLPPGTVVGNTTFAAMRVPNEIQAGAVRWYPDSGIVHQVFVAPEWRRRQVGSALLYAAEAFHQANGWPDHLRSDGRRTDIGEMFVAGLRHPQRIAPRTAEMPPMDR